MKNCFLCDSRTCPQAGIDGCYGDGCATDVDPFGFNFDPQEEDAYEYEEE